MALSIKDPETDALVRQLAKIKHVNYTAAIRLAVSNELERSEKILAAIREIQDRWAKLPEKMTAEEVDAWMYDENGLPH